jgi:integrase
VVRSLGALLADAQERGLVVRNPVRELRGHRHRGKGANKQDRRNGKLKVDVDIPTPDEIKRIIAAATGKWRPLLLTAIFTGLRASELRGLRWEDVDLGKSELHVRQRADRFNAIGAPKTHAGERTVPLPPMVVNMLREWKLKCPRKDDKLWLVFPNSEGNVEWHTNLVLRGLQPTLIKAGVTIRAKDAQGRPTVDQDGKPVLEAKYTGLHALRHFYASWCASIGLTMKVVQTRMGHSNIAVTMDTYTHIFPDAEDDSKKLVEAERALMA